MVAANGALYAALKSKKQAAPALTMNTVDLSPVLRLLEKQKEEVAYKVLETIKGSANNLKGDLGELVGLIQLKAEYDMVMPFNGIVDFIALRFPKGDDPGVLVFIDIKTGKARLSKDQRNLKALIDNHRIEFKKVSISTENLLSNNEDLTQ